MKKVYLAFLIIAVMLCGCNKNDSDSSSKDWKLSNTTEDNTEVTDNFKTEEVVTETVTEGNELSLEGLPSSINWQGYNLTVDSIGHISLSEWNFSGSTVSVEGYSTLSGSNYAMVVVSSTNTPIQTTQITMDNMKEFVLADVYGNTYDLVRYNYPDITYSDANGFADAETQPLLRMLYKTSSDTEYDNLMLCVGDEKAVGVSNGAAVVNDTEAVADGGNDESDNTDYLIFNELAGSWSGTGKPVGGGTDIALTVDINPDGTGVYTFVQGAYEESYSFTLVDSGNTFSVSIPSNNQLGINSCGGTYKYDGSILTLHIKTTFANGGAYEYDADLSRK